MLDKNYESQVHVGKIEEPRTGPSIAFGLERIGLFAVKAPIVSMIVLAALLVAAVFGIYRIKIDDSLSQLFRSEFQGLPAVRGGDETLPGDRVRRAGRGRGQDAAGAPKPRKAARHGHRPAAGRGRARAGLAVLGAAGAGARQIAGGAVPVRTAGRRGLRQVRRDREDQRDHPRQAAVRGRHAGADRAVAGSRDCRQQQALDRDRRHPQDHG